ncbi:MAG: preprotein translocase subunit YajC [Spirochaetales bacterium]|jgi:preprotein translocase subunit YajC|nr:preprotein translocase subunit YajC [Spirochaetales bacterium]
MRKTKKLFFTLCGTIFLITSCAPPPSNGETSLLGSIGPFLPFALIILLFYFLIIRPQGKQRKERNLMLGSLKKGTNILTNGGVFGKIIDVLDDDVFLIEVSKGVNIKIKKDFVNSVSDVDTKKK